MEIDFKLIDKIFERKIKFSPENVEQIIDDLIKKVKLNKLVSKRNNLINEIEDSSVIEALFFIVQKIIGRGI